MEETIAVEEDNVAMHHLILAAESKVVALIVPCVGSENQRLLGPVSDQASWLVIWTAKL